MVPKAGAPCKRSRLFVFLRALLQKLAGDDHLLDLGGALVDGADPDVAVDALDLVLAGIAVAAGELEGLVDDLNGGQEALEERARNELSMTRPGETFYRLVPDASKRAQSAGQNNR